MIRNTLIISLFVLGALQVGAVTGGGIIPDSVGLRLIQGKAYVIHEVDPGETLSSISHRYGASVAAIQKVNKLNSEFLSLGQKLLVPAKHVSSSLSLKKLVVEDKRQAREDVDAEKLPAQDPRTHKVEKGETLYSIAKKYKRSIEELKLWNDLKTNELSIGQLLYLSDPKSQIGEEESWEEWVDENVQEEEVGKVVKQEIVQVPRTKAIHIVSEFETLYGVSKKYKMTIKEIRQLNQLIDTDIKEGQELWVWEPKEEAVEEVVSTEENISEIKVVEISKEEMVKEIESLDEEKIAIETFDDDQKLVIPPGADAKSEWENGMQKQYWKITEKGKYGVLHASESDQSKFHAAHGILPLGTLVEVENPFKKQKITVKITHRPNPSDHFLIGLSQKALLYLMLDDKNEEIVIRYALPGDEEKPE